MNIKLKTFIKFIIYYIINIFIFPSKEIKQNSLLLIRLDAIGDYVLFRNFIEVLRKSKKYKDYDITLLGNRAWESLALEFDSNYIDKFIWLDKNKFNKDFIYRYKKLNEITSQGYEVILSPVYSREFFMGDTIVNFLNAKEKIGSSGDLSNMNKFQKEISDLYYTKLIDANNVITFEFNRNREFFENLLNEKLNIIKPTIILKPKKLDFKLPKNYAVCFIGASSSLRKWNIEKFARIATHLKDVYNYEIVLCGGPADIDEAKEFAKCFKDKYLNLVGKTSLVELLYVINNGNLMISNETSAPHFAVALDVENIFVISNGNHFGRFTPYPKEISEKYHVIYHPKIEKDLEDYTKLSNSYGLDSSLNINEISVQSVIKKLDYILG